MTPPTSPSLAASHSAGEHLSEDTVLRFLTGRLRENTLVAAEQHVQDCAECLELLAAAGVDDSGRSARRRIGQYELHDRLGEGGMGIVYRAWATSSRRWAALKQVRLPRPAAVGSLRREIHALERISHPGVVQVLEQGIAEGLPWYAMELLEGETLDSRIRAARGGEASAPAAEVVPSFTAVAPLLKIIRRLCHTLAFLHGEGIVHRDLAPKNVVIQPGDVPVLVDFGLASHVPAAGREGVDVIDGGTPWYMAPEQIEHELVDARADLYALGCILYEIFTGSTPFPKQSATGPNQLLQAIAAAPLPPPPRLPGLPTALAELTMRLLAKNPAERWGYAEDVARDLERAAVADTFTWKAPPARPYLYRPRLVARAPLIVELDAAIAACAAGRGGAFLMSGESGIGKTRLLLAAAARARGQRLRVVTAACAPPTVRANTSADPTAPLNVFRPLLQLIADRCRQGGAALGDRVLGDRVRILSTFEPALGNLPSAQIGAEPLPLSGDAARFRLLEAMRCTLQAFAGLGPGLVLVLDDLQWPDDLSLAFLERLDRAFLQENGILLIGSYREHEVHPDLRRHLESLGPSRLVERLSAEDIEQMVCDMLAVPRCAPGLVSSLARLSSGNPYFVTEYLRMAVEQGWLGRNTGGQWVITDRGQAALERLERLPTPLSLAGVLATRLEHLAPAVRAVAQFAAVIGQRLTVEDLQATPGRSPVELLQAVGELLKGHIFASGDDDRLRFAHDRIREAAYQSIAPEARAALHRTAAGLLASGPEDPDRLADLAHHWQMAGDPEQEHRYRCQAGERAFRVGAYREAIAHLQRALDLRPDGSDLAVTVRIERHLAEAHFGIGEMVASRRCIESLAGRAGLPMPRGLLATVARAVSDVSGALLRHATLPLLLVRSPQRRAVMAEAARGYERLAHVHFFENELVGVTASSLRALGAASRLGPSPELARVYANLSISAALLPLHDLARALARQAETIALSIEDPSALAWCRQLDGVYQAGIGQFAHAEQSFQRALTSWRELGDRRRWEETLTLLGMSQYQGGKFGQAARLRVELEEAGRQSGSQQTIGWALIGRAEDHLLRGEVSAARQSLDEAETLGPSVRRVEQMWMKALLARTRLRQGDAPGALAAADQASALLGHSIPTAFYVLEGHAALVEVYARLAPVADRRTARARRALARFARVFPFAASRERLWRGMAHARRGRLALARGLWTDTITIAQTQARPHDVALLHDCLAEHPPTPDTPDHEAARQAQVWHARARAE